LKYFISAGEPSGDLHGASLARELFGRDPDAQVFGFGGEHMTEAGCRLLYPMTNLAVMWFARVLARLHVFMGLLGQADRFFAREKPDAVICIDFPGFNWWIARRAHARGIPVFYFVPPQIWAWASGRVKKMRRYVDHVLCTLPFEVDWYADRNVPVTYVGHPYFDELSRRVLDEGFGASLRARGEPVVGLLPGSRTQEVTSNFPTMLEAARRLREVKPGTSFPVACHRAHHRELAEQFARQAGVAVDCYVGRTPEIIDTSDAVLAVSGSVSLELIYHVTPSVTLYRISRFALGVARRFMRSRYISLINLLAGEEIVPEYLTCRDVSAKIVADLLRVLDDATARQETLTRLQQIKDTVSAPGAAARAAEHIIGTIRPPAT